MRGRDRCDEIVRLIDETLVDTCTGVDRPTSEARWGEPRRGDDQRAQCRSEHPSAWRERSRSAHPSMWRPAAKGEGSDRQRLLASVDEFLAGTLREELATTV